MKQLFKRIALVVVSAAVFMLAGCDGMKHKGFNLSVKEVGPEYVEVKRKFCSDTYKLGLS